MAHESLLVDCSRQGLAILTVNRPAKLNALSHDMLLALQAEGRGLVEPVGARRSVASDGVAAGVAAPEIALNSRELQSLRTVVRVSPGWRTPPSGYRCHIMDQSITSPFERMGGEPTVRHLVDHFYRIMDESAQAASIRAMHAADLNPMRERLTEYLTAWLGGPRRYFDRADAKCIMSVHGPFQIGAQQRDEWMACMRQALSDVGVSEDLRLLIEPAMARVADALRNC